MQSFVTIKAASFDDICILVEKSNVEGNSSVNIEIIPWYVSSMYVSSMRYGTS